MKLYLKRYTKVPLARRWGGAVKLFRLILGRFLRDVIHRERNAAETRKGATTKSPCVLLKER